MVTLLTACGQGPSQATNAFAGYHRSDPNAGDAALLEGTLVLDDGCLYADSDGQRWLPVFPAEETRWDAKAQTLTLGGSSAVVGERSGFGGGEADATIIAFAPDGCDRSKVWLVTSLGLP
ncbi:hypothetical protein ACQEVF_22720 [Nonomuraea polychroma]|uniref:hypothetical protein n=1 Tax=Nonomuraea polychroma TaxID=46176 RepID=UPI003D9272AC